MQILDKTNTLLPMLIQLKELDVLDDYYQQQHEDSQKKLQMVQSL